MKIAFVKRLLPLLLLVCLFVSCSADGQPFDTADSGSTPVHTGLSSPESTSGSASLSLATPASETTSAASVSALSEPASTPVSEAPATTQAVVATVSEASEASAVTTAAPPPVTLPQSTAGATASVTAPATTAEPSTEQSSLTTPAAAAAYFTVVGAEGKILCARAQVAIDDCETVLDGLLRFCDEQKLALDTSGSGAFAYVKSLCGLKEFELGPLAGWVYAVNGVYASKGVGGTALSEGDEVVFYYTMNLGKDIRELLGS